MSALTEFLLARIAEDETAVQELDGYIAQQNEWRDEPMGPDWWFTAHHDGALWRPSITLGVDRARAECEAKRRIVEAYREERARRDAYEADDARAAEDEEQATRRRSAAARCRGLEIAVELHALPYADHPDYQQEWQP